MSRIAASKARYPDNKAGLERLAKKYENMAEEVAEAIRARRRRLS